MQLSTRATRSDATIEGRFRTGARAPCGHLAPCGCRHHGCCITCPLPACAKTGVPGDSGRQIALGPRNADIVAARAAGAPIAQIADDFHLGKRQIIRILARSGWLR